MDIGMLSKAPKVAAEYKQQLPMVLHRHMCAGLVLSTKIAPRAFGGVNSPDPLCARHALAVAALAARDMPGMFVEQMGQLVSNSLDIWRTTGICLCARCLVSY
jgi:hypothetical protein